LMITGLVPVLLPRQLPLDADDLRDPGTCNRPAPKGHLDYLAVDGARFCVEMARQSFGGPPAGFWVFQRKSVRVPVPAEDMARWVDEWFAKGDPVDALRGERQSNAAERLWPRRVRQVRQASRDQAEPVSAEGSADGALSRHFTHKRGSLQETSVSVDVRSRRVRSRAGPVVVPPLLPGDHQDPTGGHQGACCACHHD
ncbi:hypothetical protein, partial [Streptomyces sp. NPDC056820]|uniref:hypothetical protein n=1 Tax=Streptomyces sp. NPDC056820 TaxID=3345951 RepID=UPI00367A68F2